MKFVWRWLRRLLLAVLIVAALAWAVIQFAPGFGGTPSGERLARMQRSPHWKDDRFLNLQPMWSMYLRGSTADGKPGDLPGYQAPPAPTDDTQPMVHDSAERLARPIRSGLRVTWFGHSTALVEIDGVRVLVDPVWSERVTPLLVGPKRWFKPLLPLETLRDVDAVVISHDHYDHLDMPTIRAMRDWKTRFVVPLGIGAHLERWGIPAERITELDWWESVDVDDVNIVATPARHATGRVNPQRDRVLWAGYAMIGPKHRVWYSGDTGILDAFQQVGERYGPFDLTMVETGQYDWQWPDWHAGPEQAVLAHRWARGKTLMPVHWGLFTLAPHGWVEPPERVLAAAACQGVDVATPRPGVPWEPGDATSPWWPRDLSWRTARQAPIISTRAGDAADRYPALDCDKPTAAAPAG